MREYGVTVCSEECGVTRFDDGWMVQMYKSAVGFGAKFHCPHCGTLVGIDEEGPWREAMVPRAALEHLTGRCVWHGCPLPVPDSDCPHEENNGCWICDAVTAALKATGEAADE